MTEIQKKIIWKSNSNKRWVWNEIRSLLKRADAKRSADIIYHMWRLSLLCGSHSRSRAEHLIPAGNIIMIDWYFNLTSKSNSIGRLLIRFNAIFDNFVVAYFLGRHEHCCMNKACYTGWALHLLTASVYVDQAVGHPIWVRLSFSWCRSFFLTFCVTLTTSWITV